MSARALSGQFSGIPDDLESFLHVILWYSIRFLPHNCKNVGGFKFRFFDDACFYDGESTAGWTKLRAMGEGVITLDTSQTAASQLVFFDKITKKPHFILGFIEHSLALIKVYYSATRHFRFFFSHDSEEIHTPTNPAARQDTSSDALKVLPSTSKGPASDDPVSEGPIAPPQKSSQKPAHQLHDHTAFAKVFKRWLDKPWPENDKTSDQLQPIYDPIKAQNCQTSRLDQLRAAPQGEAQEDGGPRSSGKRTRADSTFQASPSPSEGPSLAPSAGDGKNRISKKPRSCKPQEA